MCFNGTPGVPVRRSRLAYLFLTVLLCGSAFAQKDRREPLTQSQVEEIREAGIDPNARIALYTKFLEERAGTLKGLTARAKSPSRAKRLDDELQDFTALMDELGSNLDEYGERKADMRPALKKLNESTPRWLQILRELPGEAAFDEARKEAIESGEDLSGDAKRLLDEQTDYFKEHKDEKGQERQEPK